jgi:hypothetical protein
MIISRKFSNAKSPFYPKSHHLLIVIEHGDGRHPPAYTLRITLDSSFQVISSSGNKSKLGWYALALPNRNRKEWCFDIEGNYKADIALSLLKGVSGNYPDFSCDRISLKRISPEFKRYLAMQPANTAVHQAPEESEQQQSPVDSNPWW